MPVTSLLKSLLQNIGTPEIGNPLTLMPMMVRTLCALILLWTRGVASQCGQPGTSSEVHLYSVEESPSIEEVEDRTLDLCSDILYSIYSM